LITPKGDWVPDAGPTILTPRGDLVWSAAGYRNAMNLNMQIYKGENFLTFWSGDKAATSGQGVYYMLDSTYSERYTVKPNGNDLHADLHEFQITADDTGLLTIYNKSQAELTSTFGNRHPGWITESSFQEVDIATGDSIFEWRAAEHFDIDDTYYWAPFDGSSESRPYDWFHINSIQKDSKGNYLVSSRHLHMVCCISPTGDVLWTLGGKRNDFQDLSDGQATNFQWQHDARWVDEDAGILTLYDNGDAGPVQSQSPRSRGIMAQLDLENHTVRLLHEYVSLHSTRAASQGSVTALGSPSDHVFVGWGHSSAFSEFSRSGDLLCEWHFGPSILDWFDFTASYRAQKVRGWVGRPKTRPDAVISGNRLFVSWNGATEVATWSLQATRYYVTDEIQGHKDEGEYEEVDILSAADGFEVAFMLADNFVADYASIRVAALDADGELLAFSNKAEVTPEPSLMNLVFTAVLLVGFLVGGWLFYVKVIRKQDLAWPGTGVPLSAVSSWGRGGLETASTTTTSTGIRRPVLPGLDKWNPWSLYRYRKLG
jgi:hypothetical protein